MNTKNIKTAIIILLIIANAFFIYSIVDLKIKSDNLPSEMIDNAVNILGENGFITPKNIIPAKKCVNPIYEGIYSQNIYSDIIGKISSFSEEELKNEDFMLIPGGISYSAKDYKYIFSDSDYFRITVIDKLYIKAEKDFIDLDNEALLQTQLLSEKGIDAANDGKVKKAGKIIGNFIKKFPNQNGKTGFEIIGFTEDLSESCERVLITQTIDRLPVDSNIVYIEIQDGKIKYFSGRWYFGEFAAKYSMPLLDSVNILFKCTEQDGVIVQNNGNLEEMDCEYTIMRHGTEGFYFVPSWKIVLESGKKLSYNMITGKKN